MGFSIDYDISDSLFTLLWTISTAFVMLQVKTGFDKAIFNYILPFLYKNIYEKYQLFLINTVNHF